MKPTASPPVRPLITPEQMQRFLANRRPITSAEFHRQTLVHLGRLPAQAISDGRSGKMSPNDKRG